MNAESCLLQGCTNRVYVPAGTGSLCKGHFLHFLTWRRRKGSGMFFKYGSMTMDERDAVVVEWGKTVKAE